MYALTIKQPWLFAITHLGKRIENRTWRPPQKVINQRIALHAAVNDDREGYEAIRKICGCAVFENAAWRENDNWRGFILATATLSGYVESSSDRWFAGPYGWILNNIYKLRQPVYCRGSQGLWQVPDEIAIRAGLTVWQ